jgi:hypothetical protein
MTESSDTLGFRGNTTKLSLIMYTKSLNKVRLK